MTFKTNKYNCLTPALPVKYKKYCGLYGAIKDAKDKERYLIAGTLKATNGNNDINLNPNNLLLNYESWKITQDNLICFGKTVFMLMTSN
jgi:hypothetical protein